MSGPIEIVQKPEFTFVGLHKSFIHALSADANAQQVIPPLWSEFLPRLDEIPNRLGVETFGLVYCDPLADRDHPDQLEYLAAARVKELGDVPTGMVNRTVAASSYAVFVHRGPIEELSTTLQQAYREWLPQSGYEHAEVADIELYDDRFCPDSATSEMEYWIPVRRVHD